MKDVKLLVEHIWKASCGRLDLANWPNHCAEIDQACMQHEIQKLEPGSLLVEDSKIELGPNGLCALIFLVEREKQWIWIRMCWCSAPSSACRARMMKPPKCLLQTTHQQRSFYVFTIVAYLQTCSVAAPNFSAQFFLVCIKVSTISFWCSSLPLLHVSWMQNSQNCCWSVLRPVGLFFYATRNPGGESSPGSDTGCIGTCGKGETGCTAWALWRNVEGVKLEAVHCLKLEALHLMSLLMQKLEALHWMSLRMHADSNFRALSRGFSKHFVFAARGTSESSGSRAVIFFEPTETGYFLSWWG